MSLNQPISSPIFLCLVNVTQRTEFQLLKAKHTGVQKELVQDARMIFFFSEQHAATPSSAKPGSKTQVFTYFGWHGHTAITGIRPEEPPWNNFERNHSAAREAQAHSTGYTRQYPHGLHRASPTCRGAMRCDDLWNTHGSGCPMA